MLSAQLARQPGRIGRCAAGRKAPWTNQGEAASSRGASRIDPIYVNFTQPAAEVMRLREGPWPGRLQRARRRNSTLRPRRCSVGSAPPAGNGRLFSDLSVGPGIGPPALRAEASNPKGQLLPRPLCVRARVAQAEVAGGIWLPDQADTQPRAIRCSWWATTTSSMSSPQNRPWPAWACAGDVAPKAVTAWWTACSV